MLLSARLAWLGIRPRTLPMALVPVLVGSALAWHQGAAPRWLILALTLLCAIAIQAGTNLFNDAADGESGNDGPDRVGPPRLAGSGLASAAAVKRSAWGMFLFAVFSGLWLTLAGGWPILLIGLTGLLSGWAYSRGPLPLSHTPWGELFVLGFFGLAAVLGSYLLQAGTAPWSAVLPGLAIGLPAAAVLLVNNLRDREADQRAGRRTLALALGRQRARGLNALMLLGPFPMLALAPGLYTMRFSWLALPLAAWLSVRLFQVSTPAAYNQQLHWTVMNQLILGLLLLAGLLPGHPAFKVSP